jgi:hypothetical protein
MITSNEMRFYGFGILALGAVAAAACSSTSSGNTGGSGTTSSSSGATTSSGSTTSSGTGGTTGTSSSGTTTSSSTTSSSSSGATVGCATSDAPPSANILAAGDGGLSVFGGLTTYGPTAATTPTATTTASGDLDITENGAASATATEYVGAVLYFSGNSTGTDCITGAAYTGVQFNISGTVTGCTVVFTINDSEHSAVSATDPKASGMAGSYPGTFALTPTTTATLVKVPFTGTGAPTGGSPASPIDKTKLESISWQYVIPQADGGTCMSSLTIDSISFY